MTTSDVINWVGSVEPLPMVVAYVGELHPFYRSEFISVGIDFAAVIEANLN